MEGWGVGEKTKFPALKADFAVKKEKQVVHAKWKRGGP